MISTARSTGTAWNSTDTSGSRMRKVYHMVCLIVTEVGGSSPHARGLLTDGEGGTVVGRIIPACPRMSPHAQGLHPEPDRVVHVHGIIPARAGFTSCGATAWAARSDHPRSRGVYAWTACGAGRGGGSSPLARGLLLRRRNNEHALVDHPRSRGVYPERSSTIIISIGSSPLARGLLQLDADRAPPQRIIPARAGFTVLPLGCGIGSQDHPRSRGVYPAYSGPRGFHRGSSPLARGLQNRPRRGHTPIRIIPARAGFTSGALISR